MKSVISFSAIVLILSGCNALRPAAETEEVVIGDCQNGAFVNQATFGGPVRCAPQSEPVFTEVPATSTESE